MTPARRIGITVFAIAACAGLTWGALEYRAFLAAPTGRLALDAAYPEMPPDARHIYLNLPVDHAEPAGAQFRGFYILSEQFRPDGPVVFCFTDGQMELVGTRTDLAFFDAQLPGLSYVLVGHRGHAPTLFPEVCPNGRVDRAAALRLYGSAQRVEDLERVRQDMVQRGLLPPHGRINIFAASGAGILAQEFLDRYGTHVSRAMLVSTGAPDLSRRLGTPVARAYADYDTDLARDFATVAELGLADTARLSYLLYQLGRSGAPGRDTQRRVLRGLANHQTWPYAWQAWRPALNWTVLQALLRSPAEEAVKVRMYEILGGDLRRRRGSAALRETLLYPWAAEILAPYLDDVTSDDSTPGVERRRFAGDALVVTGADDIVFAPSIGRAIAAEYPHGRFLLVRGGHRLELDAAYHGRLRRVFFREGFAGAETEALLASPPR